MASNYEKNMYNQLTETMEKLDAMTAQNKKDRKTISHLKSEVKYLQTENDQLKEELAKVKAQLNHAAQP